MASKPRPKIIDESSYTVLTGSGSSSSPACTCLVVPTRHGLVVALYATAPSPTVEVTFEFIHAGRFYWRRVMLARDSNGSHYLFSYAYRYASRIVRKYEEDMEHGK